MTDILKPIARLLSSTARVEPDFPDLTAADTEFPLITLTETSNITDEAFSGKERLSIVSVQVDVWDKSDTPVVVNELSQIVNVLLTSRGFRRDEGRLMKESGGVQRRCMRFRGRIDEISFRVYQ